MIPRRAVPVLRFDLLPSLKGISMKCVIAELVAGSRFCGNLNVHRTTRWVARVAILILHWLVAMPANAQALTTLASFNGSNGEGPYAGLTLSGNALYGTTVFGGTVFSVPLSGGSPTVLASFNGRNGEYPYAGLTLSGNTLYGTTGQRGASYFGTVFSVPISGGSPTVLASFNGGNGQYPFAGLTLSGNTLYGTTERGGAYGDGTVFSVPLSGGSPTVLASFNGGNGQDPQGGLTLSGNALYGTTCQGGAYGDGTVFALTFGSSFVWNVAGGGSWATSGNWNAAGLPDGADNTANFSQQTLAADATVTLDGSHTIGNMVFGDQGKAYNWTLATGSGGTLTFQVSLGTPTITVNNQTTTIAAVLAGNQGLSKTGSGTLVLAATNTYNGPTTINQGKLVVGGWLTTSAVTVKSGGILSGTGSLTSVTVNSGGTLAPGDLLGVMNLSGTLNLLSGAVMDYELDTPVTSSMVLMPSGQLMLSGQQFDDFNFTTSANFAPGSYILIDAGSLTGTLGTSTTGTIGGYSATLAVQANGNDQDLVLYVTPEPSTLMLLAAGALGLVGYGWRRRAVRRTAKPAVLDQPDDPLVLSFPSHSSPAAVRRAA